MTDKPEIDPSNFPRLKVALDRWVRTGELLAGCLEAIPGLANQERVRTLTDRVQLLKETVSQLKG